MNTFVCAMCHETHEQDTPEEEALAELRQYFGSVKPEECEIVCDDCWKKIHPDKHPHLVEEAVAETLRERMP